jgi:monovalent cation/hydrogen antiporter
MAAGKRRGRARDEPGDFRYAGGRMHLEPMEVFEWTLLLLTAAVALTGIARRIGVPYPSFLALGGTALAFVPHAPEFRLNPELTLALFVAPVLMDTAFDTSLRDLKRTWIPVTSLVLIAVGLTTATVAWLVHALVPEMPWAAAVTLGAIVAPPDAAAASAVLRQLRLPHRLLVVLEGESLLNDASALLVYRIASVSLISGREWTGSVLSAFALAIVGSVLAGYLMARVMLLITPRMREPTSSVVIQFVFTFGTWIVADRLGLSPIVTIVVNAITIARYAPGRTPARLRVPVYAVWDTVVYIVNILAFVLIGLQLRPTWMDLAVDQRSEYLLVAAGVLAAVVVIRIAWVMVYNMGARWKYRRFGPGRWLRGEPSSPGAGLVVSWCGMRGIVTLAAAYALPLSFPYRDLILLCSFCVVVGTLVLQGLTLKPLILWLGLKDDDPVQREVHHADAQLARLALTLLEAETAPHVHLLRKEFGAVLSSAGAAANTHNEQLRARVITEQRRALVDLRDQGTIGDQAFHEVEARLDIAELNIGARESG